MSFTIENGILKQYIWEHNDLNITIPDGVTSIGKSAFFGNKKLTGITIPDSVISIGDWAFSDCKKLISINIPDSVTSIGNKAFNNCRSLTGITIPDSITSIGDEAFSGCRNLKKASVPTHLQGKLDGVFPQQTEVIYRKKAGFEISNSILIEYIQENGVTDIIVPNVVTFIGNKAFYNCCNLKSITIPDSVVSIGKLAFGDCSNLTDITIPDGVTFIDEGTFRACQSLKSITLPDGVISIGNWAFRECSNLTGITIPDSVTSIGDYAFYGCSNLKTASLPAHLQGKLDKVFPEDTEITFRKNSGFETSNDIPTKYIQEDGVTDITIPDEVTSTGDKDSDNYSNPETASSLYNQLAGVLQEITCRKKSGFEISNNILKKYIQEDGVTDITIPDGVTSIGCMAFDGCCSLTSITIPDSVVSIEDSAFSHCINLLSVTIPENVTHIDNCAFYKCRNLKTVSVTSLPEKWLKGVFPRHTEIIYKDFKIRNGILTKYFRQDGITEISVPDNVTAIGKGAFECCDNLKKISIPDSVTAIDDNAFSHCRNLTSISIPDGVTHIGNTAFGCCDNIKKISIPESVVSIGENAFTHCYTLISINIPESVTTINENIFTCCYNLTEIRAAKNNKSYCDINGVLFSRDKKTIIKYPAGKSESTYTIPDSVIYIARGAFDDCDNLTAVSVPEHLKDSINEVFPQHIELTYRKKVSEKDNFRIKHYVLLKYIEQADISEITIPDNILIIGERAFHWCDSIKSVQIPKGIVKIGNRAFLGCENLTEINIPDTVTVIGEKAFYYCDSLKSISVPSRLKQKLDIYDIFPERTEITYI
ncbi:MAG: leucine-rich repeat domain-containing protein [Ruminococcus sp.]|nr:leucine-rich repeat domain-containing protein [Ruminococcus sp.]